jgi:toxin ParE1/3/4
MIRLRWSRRSRYHLEDIRRYIAQHDGAAAERVRLHLVETVKMLRSLPRLGHAGRKEGTRELSVARLPFVIVYRIDISDEDELVILGIYHAARDR